MSIAAHQSHILPLLGSKRVPDLKAADINRFMADVASGKTSTVQKTRNKRGKSIVKGGSAPLHETSGFLVGCSPMLSIKAISRKIRRTAFANRRSRKGPAADRGRISTTWKAP